MVLSYRYNPTPIVVRETKAPEKPPAVRERAAILFDMIEKAAEAGESCPSTNEIADTFGFASTASSHRLMCELVDAGLIEVVTFTNGRTATIVATGRSTKPPKSKGLHWRTRK
jgi:SOS-response transcriptional repressor LexA